MNLKNLVLKIFDKMTEKISTTIDPLIEEKTNTWEEIESIIHKWFDTNHILSWSIKYINELNENGISFNTQNGNSITVEQVAKFLEEKDFIENVKKDILKHYYEKMHQTYTFSCPAESQSFVTTDQEGNDNSTPNDYYQDKAHKHGGYMIYDIYERSEVEDRLSSDYRETDTEKQEFLDVNENKNYINIESTSSCAKNDTVKIGDDIQNYDSFIARSKTKEEHRAEIIEYLENNPNRDLSKITIHNFYQKEKIIKSGERMGTIQYIWWANITCEKSHLPFDIRKQSIVTGHWCPKCGILGRTRTPEEVEAEIWEYLENNPNREINRIIIHKIYQDYKYKSGRYKSGDKKGRYYWYADITCEKKHPEFTIKARDIRLNHWCPECGILKKTKSHIEVEAEIWEYLKKNPDINLDKITIHNIYRKDYIMQNKTKKLWIAEITCEGIKIKGKIERHTFEMRKGDLAKQTWCPICQNRITAIGNLSHIIIEYYSLKTLIELRKCNAKHEATIDEGTRPDLIISWNYVFNNEVASKLEIFSFLKLSLNNISEIAVDLTMSKNINFILSKCKKAYQNEHRFLLIVLLRVDKKGEYFTEKNCMKEIDNDGEIDNKELIKVINYEQYLKFLGLGKEKEKEEFFGLNEEEQEILKQEKKLRKKFLRTKELAIAAIKSSEAMYELIYKSAKCKKILTEH